MARVVNRQLARRAPRSTRNPERSAIVLVLVLIVVVMVALAGFNFAELMLTENKATHLHGDELRIEEAIGSGVEFLQFFLEQPAALQFESGGAFNNPTLFRGIALFPEERSSRTKTRQVRFSVVSPLAMVEGESGGIRFGVENESGRLHLADLLRWDQQLAGSGRKALLNFPGMTEAIADAILDWIDSDSQRREMGAEAEYYAGLDRPYSPRNGLPDSIDELLLVKGVTRELLFGADVNYNGQLDPDELARPSASAPRATQPTIPWASLLTIYSGRRNLNSQGLPRIDLNGMDLTKLQQQLTAALDANWAGFIIALRQNGLYAGTDSGTAGSPPVNAASGPRFTISSVLDLVGARVAIPNTTPGQPPKVYTSPLGSDPTALGEQLPKLLDATTVINLSVVRGGVSVNDAPRAVLCCVPGIDAALADRIVAARSAPSSSNGSSRQFPTWLVSEGLVDLSTMKSLMPNITAGGDVVRAQVVGHFDSPGPAARAEVVIDATITPARQLTWKDLRLFGLGYPLELLGEDGASTGDYGPRGRSNAGSGAGRNAR